MNKCTNCGYEGNEAYCPYCGTPTTPANSANSGNSYYGGQDAYGQNANYSGQQQTNYGQQSTSQQFSDAGHNFMAGSFGSYQPSGYNIPPEYQPISMWGYFGYALLFAIPCIGFIMICVFAFGGTQNLNLKNYARSYFCMFIVGIVLLLLSFMFTGCVGCSAAMMY